MLDEDREAEDLHAVGDVITYTYWSHNNSPTDPRGPVTVTDDKAMVTCPQTPSPLVPGAFIICSATYTITPADVTAGAATNVATGTAKDSVDPFGTVTSNQAPKRSPERRAGLRSR